MKSIIQQSPANLWFLRLRPISIFESLKMMIRMYPLVHISLIKRPITNYRLEARKLGFILLAFISQISLLLYFNSSTVLEKHLLTLHLFSLCVLLRVCVLLDARPLENLLQCCLRCEHALPRQDWLVVSRASRMALETTDRWACTVFPSENGLISESPWVIYWGPLMSPQHFEDKISFFWKVKVRSEGQNL